MKKVKVLLIIVIVYIISYYYFSALNTQVERYAKYLKQQEFLKCSENEGDLGCDSCYFLIYGKHIDTMELFYSNK